MKLKQFFLDTLILKLKKPPYRLAGHELSLKQIFLIIGIVTTVEIFLFSSIGIWTYNTRFRINEAVLMTPFLALFLCGLLFLFYMIAKFFENASNLFNLTVILLSGFTFVFEKYILNSQLFSEFSSGTVFVLWASFISLFLSIFRKYFGFYILVVLLVFTIGGGFATIPFMVHMFPLMLFSWIVFFTGVGILPYSPLLAFFAFIFGSLNLDRTIKETYGNRHLVVSRIAAGFTFILILSFSIYFFVRWNNINDTFREAEAAPSDSLDRDLPSAFRAAKSLDADWILKNYLKIETSFNSDTIFGLVSTKQGEFDLLGDLASIFFPANSSIENSDREKIIKVLYQEDYTDFDTIWGSENIYVSKIQSRIQIYPAIRSAYIENTLTIQNAGERQEEAVFTIHTPQGSAASRLGLWINGKEEQGRIALKSQAKKAYHQIVNIESRDPSLLEWKDGSRYRLKVFPVPGNGHRTVRVGFTVPLSSEYGVTLNPLKWTGSGIHKADMSIQIDLFSEISEENIKSKKITFKAMTSSDGELKRLLYSGSYRDAWELTLQSNFPLKGSYSFHDHTYTAVPSSFKMESAVIKHIFLVLDNSKDADEWFDIYTKIRLNRPAGSKVYLISSSIFHSEDPEKIRKFLEEIRPVNFNLFPYYMLKDPGRSLVIVSSREHSIPLSELTGSDFHIKTEEFFSKTCCPVLTAVIGSDQSDYTNSLSEMKRILIAAKGLEDTLNVLKTQKFRTFNEDSNTIPVETAGFSITKSKGFQKNSDPKIHANLMRLYSYKNSLQSLGKTKFINDVEQREIYHSVRDSGIVSPVSSLIVLESETDYGRFGISKNTDGPGPASLSSTVTDDSPLGMVPEPEEYALLAVLILLFSYLNREKIRIIILRLASYQI